MIDHVVFDVEIAKTIEEVGGWDNTEKMGVAVACLWQYQDQRMRIYGPDDVEALQDRLLSADRVSSYNGFLFDFPVVFKIPKRDWIHPLNDDILYLKGMVGLKSNDILRRIWISQGFNPDRWDPKMGGTKLDDVAGATIGSRKIGNGADAPKWYQAGLVQRVVNYCADDVAIEPDLTDFVDRYGYVLIPRSSGVEKLRITSR